MKETIHTIVPAQPGFYLVEDIGNVFESMTHMPSPDYCVFLNPIVAWSLITIPSMPEEVCTIPVTICGSHNNTVSSILLPTGRVEHSIDGTWDSLHHYVQERWEEWKISQQNMKSTTPEPKPAKKVKVVEPTPEPVCPTHEVAVPEDLLGAVMALVNGDKAKKDTLVKILAKYEAKTIGSLGGDHTAAFWAEASKELA